MKSVSPFAKAVEDFPRGQKGLADALEKKQSTVWGWVQRGWPAPQHCPAIEKLTGVSVEDLLRPAFEQGARKAKPRKKRAA